MSTAAPLPGEIRDKLSGMDRQQRELAVVGGLGRFLILCSVSLGACLIADAYGNLSPGIRSGLLAGLCSVAVIGGWCWLIRPFSRRKSWAELAAAVERQHPELSERLTTLVELNADPHRAGSPLMRELLTRQTVKAVSQVDFTAALPAGKSLQRAALGLVALAILLFPFLLPGGRYALSWNRLLVPWGNYDWGSRLAFHIPDGDRVIPKGSDVTLRAELRGEPVSETSPMDATLRWVDSSGRSQQRAMSWNGDEQAYEITLPRVDHSFRFHVASRWAVSKEYQVTAAERPRITAWSIDIQPPGYTGLPAQTLDAIVGELTVPEQSRLRFHWQFAEPVSDAAISWPVLVAEHAPQRADDQTPQSTVRETELPLTLSADRQSATVEVLATASGPLDVKLTSDLGLTNEPAPHLLMVISDQPPEISVERREIVAAVGPADLLPIPLRATDDYGLSAVELHWMTSHGEEGREILPDVELSNRTLDWTWALDIGELPVASGQSVTVRVRVADNRPVPSPQETWSEAFVVSISADADTPEAQQLAAAQESLEQRLNEMQEAVALQKQAVNTEHAETAREAVKGGRPPDNQAELKRLEERQAELREQLESLRQDLADRPLLEQAAAEHVPRIEQQLAEAQQSLEQAARSEEARDQIEQLSRSLDRLGQAEDQLEKLKQESKALAALEQEIAELGRLSRQAEKLANEAERLEKQSTPGENGTNEPPEATPSPDAQVAARPDATNPSGDENSPPTETARLPDPQQTAEQLEQLQQETAELAEHLDDLLRRRPELLEAARQNELDRLARLAETAERLAEQQRQLAEALAREEHSQSSPPSDSDPANSPNQAGDNSRSSEATSKQAPEKNPPAADAQPASSGDRESDAAKASSPDSAAPEEKASTPNSSPSEQDPATDGMPESAAGDEANSPTAGESTPLAQQIAAAAEHQQQLAREAARMSRAAEQQATNSETPQAKIESPPPGSNPSDSKESGSKPPGAESAGPAESSPAAGKPSAEFAKQSQAAAQAARAGDLEQAARHSEQAAQAARRAADGQPPAARNESSPNAERSQRLAERQQELADEFQRLAESPEARRTAQQQSQRDLSQAAQTLTESLEQSSDRLSQQPLDLPQASRNAGDAKQSTQAARQAMESAAQDLQQGESSAAGEQAQTAGEQLQQAARQAAQAAEGKPSSSPQSERLPGRTASQIAQASSQLRQAREQMAQRQPSESGSAASLPAESPSGEPSESGPSGEPTDSPGSSPAGAENPSAPTTSGEPKSGESNAGPSGQPGEAEGQPAGQPGESSSGESSGAELPEGSPLRRSADALRQASRALAGASQSVRTNGQAKRDASGKPGSSTSPGSRPSSDMPLADQSSDPGELSETPEGFAEFGAGGSGQSGDIEGVTNSTQPKAGSRNWGRLPKHLQSEIRQGSTKKHHPEYARQIKRYFEQIAQPAEKK